jgi:hypothetical protein
LVDQQRRQKPIMQEFAEFREWIDNLPFDTLPPASTEAICLLGGEQDQWGVGYTAFILAKQAGFTLTFHDVQKPLPLSDFYFMPSVCGMYPISRRRWFELLQRVEAGATLYVSLDDGLLYPLNNPCGVEIQTRSLRNTPVRFTVEALGNFQLPSDIRLTLRTTHASVLGSEEDGNPVFTQASYGKGQIYFLSVPIERILMTLSGAFHATDAQPFWKLYQIIGTTLLNKRTVTQTNPHIGLTEHPVSPTERIIVAINYSPEDCTTFFHLSSGWNISRSWLGSLPSEEQATTIPGNHALVFTVLFGL